MKSLDNYIIEAIINHDLTQQDIINGNYYIISIISIDLPPQLKKMCGSRGRKNIENIDKYGYIFYKYLLIKSPNNSIYAEYDDCLILSEKCYNQLVEDKELESIDTVIFKTDKVGLTSSGLGVTAEKIK